MEYLGNLFVRLILEELAKEALRSFAASALQNRQVVVQAKLNKLEHHLLKIETAIEESEKMQIDRMSLLRRLVELTRAAHRGHFVLDAYRYPDENTLLPWDHGIGSERRLSLPSSHNPAKRFCAEVIGGIKTAVFNGERYAMLDDTLQMVEMLAPDANEFISLVTGLCNPRLGRRQLTVPFHRDNFQKHGGHLSRPFEQEQIIRALLLPDPIACISGNTDIILVFGAPDVGKWTLVDHLVARDDRVNDCYPISWGFPIDSSQLEANGSHGNIKERILKWFARFGRYMNEESMDVLERKFSEKLCTERCLLILSNVPNTLPAESWVEFLQCFRSSAMPGSKIILISEHDDVGIDTPFKFHIEKFSNEEFWFYFKHQAFGCTSPDDFPALLPIGPRIADSLSGSFKHARIVGRFLMRNLNRHYWEQMLRRLSNKSSDQATPYSLQPREAYRLCMEVFPAKEAARFANVIHYYLEVMLKNRNNRRELTKTVDTLALADIADWLRTWLLSRNVEWGDWRIDLQVDSFRLDISIRATSDDS